MEARIAKPVVKAQVNTGQWSRTRLNGVGNYISKHRTTITAALEKIQAIVPDDKGSS